MEKKKLSRSEILKLLQNVIFLLIGSTIYAGAISMLLDPYNFAPGGISGISIVISSVLPVSVGLCVFVLNIPIIILGFVKLTKKFMFLSLFVTAISSVFMDMFSSLNRHLGSASPIVHTPLLSALAGGALLGLGIGMIMLAGGSSGGTDIIIRILRLRHKHIKTGIFHICFDSIVITASAFVFKDIDTALYATIAVIASSLVLDIVLYGRDEAKLLFIISHNHAEIVEKLTVEVGTGVTYIQGEGAFSGNEKKVIFTAIKKYQITRVREIVRAIDENAFMIITSASEIYGEGYKAHSSEEL